MRLLRNGARLGDELLSADAPSASRLPCARHRVGEARELGAAGVEAVAMAAGELGQRRVPRRRLDRTGREHLGDLEDARRVVGRGTHGQRLLAGALREVAGGAGHLLGGGGAKRRRTTRGDPLPPDCSTSETTYGVTVLPPFASIA
jgi:hypothetical protein